MNRILNGNAISLIVVKLIFFSAILIGFLFYLRSEAKDTLASLKPLSKKEYIKNYKNYLADMEKKKQKALEEIDEFGDPVITPIIFFVMYGAYFMYQFLQLLLSVYVVDKIRKTERSESY